MDKDKHKEKELNDENVEKSHSAFKQQSKDNLEKEKEIPKTLEEKLKESEDKLLRSLAEMENQRRRFEKEKDDAFEYGGFSFAKETLNLLDNLERSKKSLENDEKLKNTDAIKKISEHLEIIYNDMLSIFKRNSIEPIEAINQKLDPNLHQAMMEIEDDSKDVGTIVQEIQKGFTMKDRLLRPSLVGVSKKSSKVEDKKDEKDGKNQ